MSSLVKLAFGDRSLVIMKQIRLTAARLAAFEVWGVAILAGITMISARMLPWTLVVAGLFWIVRYLAFGHFSVRTAADWPIILLMMMLPVTLWTTALPEVTRLAIYRLLVGVALYYAIVNWATCLPRLRLLARGAILLGLLLALLALVSVEWSLTDKLALGLDTLRARLPRLTRDTINPNVMAGALVLLIPYALASLLFGTQRKSWLDLLLAGISGVAIISVLVLTQSRGGLMALGATLLLMACLRWRRSWIPILGLGLVSAFLATRLGHTAILDGLSTTHTLGSLATRLEVWSRGLYAVQDFPLTGIGIGSFHEVAEVLYPFFTTTQDVPHTHNLFLQVAVDLGTPGLIAWLALWMVVTVVAWQTYRQGRSQRDSTRMALGAGLLGSQTALAVHGLMDAVSWGAVRTAMVTWAIWGLAMAAGNLWARQLQANGARSADEGIDGGITKGGHFGR
jgi:putative inorganic carbon (HCO3(-)) transporter